MNKLIIWSAIGILVYLWYKKMEKKESGQRTYGTPISVRYIGTRRILGTNDWLETGEILKTGFKVNDDGSVDLTYMTSYGKQTAHLRADEVELLF